MKKLLTIAFAMLLGASLSFAQAAGSTGSTDKGATDKSATKKSKKSGKKGGKKSKKGAAEDKTAQPK